MARYYGTELFLESREHRIHWDTTLPPNTAVAVGYSVLMLSVLTAVLLLLFFVPILLSLTRVPADMVNIGSNSLALSAACHVSPISYAVMERRTTPTPAKNDPSSSTTSLIDKSGGRGRSTSICPYADDVGSPPPAYHRSKAHDDIQGGSEDDKGFELRRLPTFELCRELLKSRATADESLFYAASRGSGLTFGNVARRRIRWGVVRMPQDWYDQFDREHERPVEHLGFGVEEDNVAPPIPGRWYA
ncbi:hypothetical protein SLS62_009963 [Diatrype stigma]|uniref:Uncharacterized protein n=1 Tax=Diatrype stigma TaxID=117547 RepID=A0AAN9YJE8_9PEZI